MKSTLSIGLVAILAMFCFGCSSEVPEGTYRSKLGNFTCQVPHLERPGSKMAESATADTTFVNFTDDFGTAFRIESMRLGAEEKADLAGESQTQFLKNFFHEGLMPQEFLAVSPLTQILCEEPLDTAAGKSYFAVVKIPHGSTLSESVNGADYEQLDSVRGVVLFVQHDFIYVVSSQEWPMTAMRTPPIPIANRINIRLEDIQQAVGEMTFQ